MTKIKNLSVLDEFTCIAERCPQHCCKGWDINVDENTFTQWQSIEDDEVKENLLSKVTIKINNKVITTQPDGNCSHLMPDGLCMIHSQLGEQYLTHVCDFYPRLTFKNNIASTKTAHLSCPEITRLVVEAKNGTLFNQVNDTQESSTLSLERESELLEIQAILVSYHEKLNAIDNIGFAAMIYDTFSILSFLTDSAKKDNYSAARFIKACGKSKKIISKRLASFKSAATAMKGAKQNKIDNEFWLNILNLYQLKAIDDFQDIIPIKKIQKELLNNTRSFNLAVNRVLDKNIVSKDARAKLNNYLCVKLHNHGFPWNPYKGSYIATYIDSILPFCVVLFIITALDMNNVVINDEMLIKVIYKVERLYSHNQSILLLLQNNAYWQQSDQYKSIFLSLV